MPTVCIVYPADPIGVVPGGIDTFIRGIAGYAPADIRVRLIGMTTDPISRPLHRWTRCAIGDRVLDVYPLVIERAAGVRTRLPLSLRFSAALVAHRHAAAADILEFHRLEPALVFLGDRRPKNAFIHQNMKALRNRHSDILWSRVPSLFYRFEDRLLPTFESVFVVVEEAVAWYQERFPARASRFRFTPTWFDPAVFRSPSASERSQAREEFLATVGFPPESEVLLSVGRLDHQKDPLLLARAFARLAASRPAARLVFVGDGILRGEVERVVVESGLGDRVWLAGLRSREQIARILWAADLFVLASSYEGMPMSVLEALGSGVPVVTTDVGEVRRVVLPGRNGMVIAERTPEGLAAAMSATLDARSQLGGSPCTAAASRYTPTQVLEPVYENYRRLATESRRAA